MDRVVAIRDGKTSTETIRQNGVEQFQIGDQNGVDGLWVEEIFEEYVVLDSAGRLQVPQEYLEHFGIKGRVKLDLTDEGILISPALHLNDTKSAEHHADEIAQTRQSGGLLGFLSRWKHEHRDEDGGHGDTRG